MRFSVVGPRPLLDAVRQLATHWEPWAEKIYCNVDDYVQAGLRGDETRVPIPKEAIGSAAMFGHFTHPLSPERFEENAQAMRQQTHVVELIPDWTIQVGMIVSVTAEEITAQLTIAETDAVREFRVVDSTARLLAFVQGLSDDWVREGNRGDNPGVAKAAFDLLGQLHAAG